MTRNLSLSRRGFLGAAAAVTGAAALPLGVPGRASAADAATGYLMAHFTESPGGLGNDYGLHLATSTDGLSWTPLNQGAPVVRPTAGTLGLRDPFILRKQDNTFVVVATDLSGTNTSGNNQYIHLWDSADLLSYTNYRRFKLHDYATHSWAPEAFYDASRGKYGVIYAANNGASNNGFGDVILVNYTSDFVNFEAAQVWFAPTKPIIDATLAYENGTHYLYCCSMQDAKIYGYKATSLSPRAFDNGLYTKAYAGPGATEAPIVTKSLTSSTWYLWGDNYRPANADYLLWSSTSIATDSWTPVSKRLYTAPLNVKHAGILPISTAERTALVNRYGTPTWNRLKSYNYPERYVRHANYVGRIDAYPFDPYTDSMFTLVPGLAGSSGVSFRSRTDPDLYLRHENFAIKLARNTGSAAFAADATFTKSAGLADSSWTTFRSWNYPERALRHSQFVLRIDPISSSSSTTDKQDATFQITY